MQHTKTNHFSGSWPAATNKLKQPATIVDSIQYAFLLFFQNHFIHQLCQAHFQLLLQIVQAKESSCSCSSERSFTKTLNGRCKFLAHVVWPTGGQAKVNASALSPAGLIEQRKALSWRSLLLVRLRPRRRQLILPPPSACLLQTNHQPTHPHWEQCNERRLSRTARCFRWRATLCSRAHRERFD